MRSCLTGFRLPLPTEVRNLKSYRFPHMISRRSALPFAALFLFAALHAAEPTAGATRAEIEAELGKPTGVRSTATGDIAVYPRGTVTYRGGRAAELKLIPRETWLKQLEAEKKAAEEARLRAKRLADEYARSLVEAMKARDALLASEAFKQLSPSAKIVRLDELLRQHPAADVTLLRADLTKTVAVERDTARRLADAEAACAEADRKLAVITDSLNETRRALDAANIRAEAATKRIEQLELGLRAMADHYRNMDTIMRSQLETASGSITTKQVISR